MMKKIEEMARAERRPLSSMARVLLEEALERRVKEGVAA
jgi:hypothetical protein